MAEQGEKGKDAGRQTGSAEERRAHWERVYEAKRPDAVSWYQPHLSRSIEAIRATGLPLSSAILDIGGGASTLAEDLLDAGYSGVSVLDISRRAIDEARARLGPKADGIRWIVSDLFDAELPAGRCDLWHDRALFHFLQREEDRARYCEKLVSALRPGGYAVLATFGPNGPMSCSGLPTIRYSPEAMALTIGPSFTLLSHQLEDHHTPSNAVQQFIYCTFRKA